jgi:unsaturated chondroitin disaccharide hydrolase
MREIKKEPLVSSERYLNSGFLTKEEIKAALDTCIQKIDRNIEIFGENFPRPATKNNTYEVMDNTEWTNGFWTGILWLCDLLLDKGKRGFTTKLA